MSCPNEPILDVYGRPVNSYDKTGFPTVFGVRTGEVTVQDFDRGILDLLATTRDVISEAEPSRYRLVPLAAEERQNKVRIIFVSPEQVLNWDILPMIVVTRDGTEKAAHRWSSETQGYAIPAQGAQLMQVTTPGGGIIKGFDYLEARENAFPFDFTYSVSIYSRYRREADLILRSVIRGIKPYFNVTITDSLFEERVYSAESTSISDITELTDIADRVVGFTLSMTVFGELDNVDPVIEKTVEKVNVCLEAIPPKSVICAGPPIYGTPSFNCDPGNSTDSNAKGALPEEP